MIDTLHKCEQLQGAVFCDIMKIHDKLINATRSDNISVKFRRF